MKKTSLTLAALCAASALAALPAFAQTQTPPPEAPAAAPASPLTFNAAITSDYRYRGISQTRKQPAIQAGVDYALPAGFYIGAWATYIKWIKDAGGNAGMELDLYGGYKGEISKDLSYDVGVLRYQYPKNQLSPSTNTTELYGAMTFGPATVKYSHSVTNLFGFAKSKNSNYLEVAAGFDVGAGIMVTPHLGYQRVAHNSNASYTDYSLIVSKDFDGFVLSGGAVGARTKTVNGTKAYASPADGKDLGKLGAVVTLKYNF